MPAAGNSWTYIDDTADPGVRYCYRVVPKTASGSTGIYSEVYARAEGRELPVLQYSKKCLEDIGRLERAGYQPYDSVIRFICVWKKKEDEAECALILADVCFRRREGC